MATITVRALEIAYTPFYVYESVEAVTQTYRRGALLTYNSDGQITEAATDENQIVGLATEPGQNKAAGTNPLPRVRYNPLLPGTIVEGNLVASASVSHTVHEGTVIGLAVGIIKRTTESDVPWAFDAGETTAANQCFRIIGMKDASGDVNPRVYAMLFASKCVWTGTNTTR